MEIHLILTFLFIKKDFSALQS